MDHNRATETQAVERYLLGEMPPEERDDFEGHYFACAECAKDVRAAARFRANAREVLRDPEQLAAPEKESHNPWWRLPTLVPLAAAIALIGVVAYQNTVVIPALRSPQFPSTLTLDGATRGSLPHLEEGAPVDLQMALDPSAEGSRVAAELVGESVKVTSPPVPAPGHGQPFHVYFPGKFHSGRYHIAVRDVSTGRELVRNEFEIMPKETNANER
jgi:hypothetical protein